MEKNLYIDASHPNETRIVLKSQSSIEDLKALASFDSEVFGIAEDLTFLNLDFIPNDLISWEIFLDSYISEPLTSVVSSEFGPLIDADEDDVELGSSIEVIASVIFNLIVRSLLIYQR